ncbi:MAG: IS66 family transposase, partial [Candidatus Methanoperedenaceae archaeon]|nr:IS66 family transposase [Candidatus Methanoperedenaceae archaeon]
MKNEDESENLKKHIHDLERKIIQLEEDLEKERNENKITWQQKKRLEKENKDLKKQLAQLLGSAPT